LPIRGRWRRPSGLPQMKLELVSNTEADKVTAVQKLVVAGAAPL
jgi:hypothetical protein